MYKCLPLAVKERNTKNDFYKNKYRQVHCIIFCWNSSINVSLLCPSRIYITITLWPHSWAWSRILSSVSWVSIFSNILHRKIKKKITTFRIIICLTILSWIKGKKILTFFITLVSLKRTLQEVSDFFLRVYYNKAIYVYTIISSRNQCKNCSAIIFFWWLIFIFSNIHKA